MKMFLGLSLKTL